MGTVTTTKDYSGTQTLMPTVAPEYSPLQKTLLDYFMGKMGVGSALPPGYEVGGVSNITSASNAAQTGLANELASRGLGRSPIAANVMNTAAMNRAGQISQFENNLPLLNRQLKNEDIANAANFFQLGLGKTGETSGTETDVSKQKLGFMDFLSSLINGGMGALTGGLLGKKSTGSGEIIFPT